MLTPRKRLSVGIGATPLAPIRKQLLRGLARDLQPEGVGAEIQLAGPGQGPALVAQRRPPEKRFVGQRREDALARVPGKIDLTRCAIGETQPHAVVLQDFQGDDSFHEGSVLRRKRSRKSARTILAPRNPGQGWRLRRGVNPTQTKAATSSSDLRPSGSRRAFSFDSRFILWARACPPSSNLAPPLAIAA